MSSIKAITVPKWGLTMTEGTLTDWLVEEGETVSVGDSLADMETSKIINVVESNASGIFRRKVAMPGETLEIAALIGVIAEADTPDADIDAFIASFTPEEVAKTDLVGNTAVEAPSPAVAEPTPVSVETKGSVVAPASSALAALSEAEDDSAVHATRYARQLAGQYQVNLHNVSATGRNNRISKQDVLAAIAAAGGSVAVPSVDKSATPGLQRSTADDSAIKATAVARRLARQFGINLNDCRVSGNRGRVCKADVEAANALLNGAPVTAAALASGAVPEELAAPDFEESTMSGMRKTIAVRLQQSKQQAPHFRLVADCQLDALLALRQQINDSHPGIKVSVNDFIVKAAAMALVKHPDVNIQFDGETIRRFKHADISIAVAMEGGLITPIVKSADTLSLSAISTEVRDLATRAKAGTLKPDEFVGGTFCISNLGMYGIKQFDAIINPPQAGIMAVGAGEQRVIVAGQGTAVATVVTLSTSFDHRVVDGAVGAEFINDLKRFIEHPALMLA